MKVEINSKNKKIALLGFIIFVVVLALVFGVGSVVRKNGNLEADANTAVGALKAQLVDLKVRPKTIDLTIKKAYTLGTDTDVSLASVNKEDIVKVFGNSGEDDEPAVKSLKAESVVYFEYEAMEYESMDDKTNGEKLGGDRFLAYICENDIIVIINNESSDGTVQTSSEDGFRSAIVKYQNTGLALINYVTLNSDNGPILDFPKDFSKWREMDAAALTDFIAIDSLDQ